MEGGPGERPPNAVSYRVMMRRDLRFAMLFALVLLAPPSVAGADDALSWPDVPADAKALILATGDDRQYTVPKGCFDGAGGTVYRPEFERWLEDAFPHLHDRVWVSTGNVLDPGLSEEPTGTPAETYRLIDRTGYAAVGVGSFDVANLGIEGLLEVDRRHGFPLVSTNLVVHETGRPVFRPSVTHELADGRRLAFLAATVHDPGFLGGTLETGSVVTVDEVEAVRREVERLRDEVDLVVVLSTARQGVTEELSRIDGVDLVLAATLLLVRDRPTRVEGGAPVLWLGAYGLHVGRIALGTDGRWLDEPRVLQVKPPFPVDTMTGVRSQ